MNEQGLFQRLMAWQAGLAAAGIAAWWWWGGGHSAASFLAGALASGVSFWLLHRLTGAMAGEKVSAGTMIASALRLLVVGAILSAILTSYELRPGAAACGILVVIASILLETIRQHFYAS